MTEQWDAVVVGSGPNGLAAAITLAQAGRSVLVLEGNARAGGALQSDTLGDDNLVRDLGAAVLPFAAGSPFFRQLPLEDHGLVWRWPSVSFTHPLDDGRVAVAYPSLPQTTERLGVDGAAYQRMVGPYVEAWDDLASAVMGPPMRIPRHTLLAGRFVVTGARSAHHAVKRFSTEEAAALFAGAAAHSVLPLTRAFTAAFGVLFCTSAHAHGWPVVEGGTAKLADALTSVARGLGVEIRCAHPVAHLDELPPHRCALFDTSPSQLLAIAGDSLPPRYRNRLRRFRHAPGICKVDYVLDGPVPWADEASAQAATVHVGGTFAEVAAAEAETSAGRVPARPFVLVAQQSAADPTRVVNNRQALWTYSHVPKGSDADTSDAIEEQLERFAPGFRDRIVARHVTTGTQLAALSPNLIGGDVTGGSVGGSQLVARPRLVAPYRTPNPSLYLCSASTPPGGGVHGMAGHHAARSALRHALR